MPKLTIDNIPVEVPQGASVLQACECAGIEVPHFCYHDKLSIAGSCRMCLVEVEKTAKPVASCALPVTEGMVVHTNSPMAQKARKGVMELLLINHPLDCPICDQGGECDLQDQAMAYGGDRSRYSEEKRIVGEKELGPLVKTAMTRCIQCTRCVRFMDEIAGTPELGGLFRGEHLEITNADMGPLTSELSGNIIDICPVGALTNKPLAFQARSWELQKTESIDILDAVGCNIRIDARGNEVMRILPRLNEDINEEWINDKSRFSCDGLRRQRLDCPYARSSEEEETLGSSGVANGDEVVAGRTAEPFLARKRRSVAGGNTHESGTTLRQATWESVCGIIYGTKIARAGERVAAIAGDFADVEALFALKLLMQSIGSPHIDCRQDGAEYDVSARAGYIMNSGISGIDEADAVLLIGTNPRHEATLVNARIRKRWLRGGMRVGLIGAAVDLTYPYQHIGNNPAAIKELIEGRHPFAETLRNAKNPMVIVGAGALARPDGAAIHYATRELAEKFNMVRPDWNGFNVLQLAASRVGGLDVGFTPQAYGLGTRGILNAAKAGKMDVVILLGADEIDMAQLGNAFVVYIGHHGDRGAHRADVILPSAAYTEKDGIYVNTEGRAQLGKRAVFPPGEAKEDWKIIRALSDALGKPLPFDTLTQLRAKLIESCPTMGEIGKRAKAEWKPFGKAGELSRQPFTPVISNFYMTDPISRASPTMAKCTEEIGGVKGR